jgi:hypothetical protein
MEQFCGIPEIPERINCLEVKDEFKEFYYLLLRVFAGKFFAFDRNIISTAFHDCFRLTKVD